MRSLLTVGALALLASSVLAWGPASHYWFTCQAVHGKGKTCVESHNDLISGTELPDAFIFGDFVTGPVPGELPCAGLGALHNPFYAGVMVQLAVNDSIADPAGTCYNVTDGSYKPGYTSANCFNAYEFGVGFGAHVVGDVAGFLFPDAYLGQGYKAPNNDGPSEDVNWQAVWPFMTGVDAHVLQTQFEAGTECPSRVLRDLGSNATAFLNRANRKLTELYPENMYPPASATQIAACAKQWSRVIRNECAKAKVLPHASYSFEMTYNDQYGASSFQEATQNFEQAQKCAIKGIKLWRSAISEAGATPLSATYAVVGSFYDWFARGECSPMNITMPPTQMPREVRQGPGADLEVMKEIVQRLGEGNLRQQQTHPVAHHNHYLHHMGWVPGRFDIKKESHNNK